jgi:hypothetical protein
MLVMYNDVLKKQLANDLIKRTCRQQYICMVDHHLARRNDVNISQRTVNLQGSHRMKVS